MSKTKLKSPLLVVLWFLMGFCLWKTAELGIQVFHGLQDLQETGCSGRGIFLREGLSWQ